MADSNSTLASEPLSGGTIAGIVVGSVGAAVIFVAFVCGVWCMRTGQTRVITLPEEGEKYGMVESTSEQLRGAGGGAGGEEEGGMGGSASSRWSLGEWRVSLR